DVEPHVVEDYAEQALSPSQADVDRADPDAACPTTGTWTAGKGRKKHKVGTYACYFYATDDGGQAAAWRWTDTKRGIVAVAANVAGDVDALHEWWLSAKSGPLGG